MPSVGGIWSRSPIVIHLVTKMLSPIAYGLLPIGCPAEARDSVSVDFQRISIIRKGSKIWALLIFLWRLAGNFREFLAPL